MYTLDGQLKRVEEAVDHIQFYQNSRQFRSPFHKHEVLRTVALEEDKAKCLEKRKSTRDLLELQNRMQKLERTLMGLSSLRRDPTVPVRLEQGTLILRLQQYRTADRDGEKCAQRSPMTFLLYHCDTGHPSSAVDQMKTLSLHFFQNISELFCSILKCMAKTMFSKIEF